MEAPPDQSTPLAEGLGWSVWTTSQDGATTWWATRDRLLTESEMRDGLVHTLSAENEARLHILISAQKPKLSNAVRQTLQELTTEHADDWRFEYVAGDPNPWRAVRDKGAHAEVRARAPEVLRDRIRVVEWADGSDDQAAGQ